MICLCIYIIYIYIYTCVVDNDLYEHILFSHAYKKKDDAHEMTYLNNVDC